MVKLPSVILLWPTPWIGKTRTRPEILYGPIKYKAGPFTLKTYFPAGSFWKPLKIKSINKSDVIEQYRSTPYSILVKRNSVNPIKSTSVNFNSTFTGLSAPCLIRMLGMCNGSIFIKLMPLCPTLSSKMN